MANGKISVEISVEIQGAIDLLQSEINRLTKELYASQKAGKKMVIVLEKYARGFTTTAWPAIKTLRAFGYIE